MAERVFVSIGGGGGDAGIVVRDDGDIVWSADTYRNTYNVIDRYRVRVTPNRTEDTEAARKIRSKRSRRFLDL